VYVCLFVCFGTPKCHEMSLVREKSRMASEDLKSSEDGPSKGWGLKERRVSIFEMRDAVLNRILCLMSVMLFAVSRLVANCCAEFARVSAFSMCDGIQ